MAPATGRANQRLRTRKDLLRAAFQLLRQGRTPTMDEVASEAMVSRATAYRYFPTLESLLIEAPLDGDTPDPDALFRNDAESDPALRTDKAEAALHDMVCRNETQLRLLLMSTLSPRDADATPARQNRRTALIEAALAPARGQFDDEIYARLCAALALIFGIESAVVFRDVLGIDQAEARRIKSWTVRSLVGAALEESRKQAGGSAPQRPRPG